MPMRLGPFLENKVDLGCHTEIIMPLDLMRKGVVNNRRRNLVPGKTSLTAMMATSPEDEAFIDGNPNFDMRDMDLNNDPAYFSRNDNIVAVNAPLEVSLFGEIGIERIGRRYFRGVGGQVEMVIGALMAKNGRSIHGMVSRKLTSRGEWMSKIVPQLTPPSIASIPRQCADFIITEYGVASLQGKTEREIANELIAISHPDFRAELRKEAQKLLYA
jgi:acyl-CoA hydrolase